MDYPNIAGYLRTALDNPVMRLAAWAAVRQNTGLLGEQTRSVEKGLRLSDAGSCSLELWFKLRNAFDLPLDPVDMQLCRFDTGALLGAWVGALVAEAARADGWLAELEREVTFNGIPGHIDVRLWRNVGPCKFCMDTGIFDKSTGQPCVICMHSHVVEIKSKYETAAIKNPEKEATFQLLQAGSYCHSDDAALASQSFTLLVVSPSATKGVRAQQFHFDAAPYRKLAQADFARMSAALEDEPPAGDPPDKWRCFTCQAGQCKRNKNKAANSTELLLA